MPVIKTAMKMISPKDITLCRSNYYRHLLAILSISILATACVDKFNPNLNGDLTNLLVVEGSVIKEDSIQYVILSKSSSVYGPIKEPVKQCQVWVTDELDRKFEYHENRDGYYNTVIPSQFLYYNNQFKLHILTPAGEKYESEFDTILKSSPIDSIYFNNENYQTSAEQFSDGFQFYIDLKAPIENTRNYYWEMEETYEYRSFYPSDAVYLVEDTMLYILSGFERFKYQYCWKTNDVVGSFFCATTSNLTVNEKKKIELHYIPGFDLRMKYHYSLLMKQYSLSENAYKFWNQNKVESSENGGLYQTQPSSSYCNIRNINNPDEQVLGFFWASSYTKKRVHFKGPGGNLFPSTECQDIYHILFEADSLILDTIFSPFDSTIFIKKIILTMYDIGFRKFHPYGEYVYIEPNGIINRLDKNGQYILYSEYGDPIDKVYPDNTFFTIIGVEPTLFGVDTIWGYGDNYCFDCRLQGGTNIKPEFMKIDENN